MPTIRTLVEPLRSVDWNDVETVDSATKSIFAEVADNKNLLRRAVTALHEDLELLALCEHYDILDKLVLFADDESGIRIRLHVFGPGYHDRPHNHRWTYASHILRGHYRHRIYSPVDLRADLDPSTLHAVHVRRESIGASYALHHSAIHAVVAEPGTVSLVVRGPAMADRFLVMDNATGQAWWQYGAARESPEDADRKRMTQPRFEELVASLDDWNLI